MTNPAPPPAIPSLGAFPLSLDEEILLARRLGQWRHHPLQPAELAELLPRVSDAGLALSLAERLGMAGPETISLLLPLCREQGISSHLIRALGLCRHPRARDQLLSWLPLAGEYAPAVLDALACWGNQVDLGIIEQALLAPGRDFRLAGLALLTFRCRSLPAPHLVRLTAPLLDDLRAEVVIATLRLLQRSSHPAVLAAIDSCIRPDALPGVAEVAIQGLGSIATPESCRHLLEQIPHLARTHLEPALRRQLAAQVGHRDLVAHHLAALTLKRPDLRFELSSSRLDQQS
jgi:hypothetical protein